MTVRPFHDGDAAAWHAIVEAARRVDDPTHPPTALGGTQAYLAAPAYDGAVQRWLAESGVNGSAVGTAEVFLPATANLGWGFADVVVHPAHRRSGHGRALLAAVAAAVRDAGRDTVVLTADPATGANRWASAMGATKVQELLESALGVPSAAIPDVAAPDGYRLEHWVGACPEPLLTSFLYAKDAMADAPDSGLGYESTKTTADRVRAAEESWQQRGVDLWVVVAVHEASGEVAGLTELAVDRYCPELAHQEDTAVVPAHRGHGIGLWIKADMLRRLRAADSSVREIRTTTDFTNAYMLAVNDRLGFRRTGVSEQWLLPVTPERNRV